MAVQLCKSLGRSLLKLDISSSPELTLRSVAHALRHCERLEALFFVCVVPIVRSTADALAAESSFAAALDEVRRRPYDVLPLRQLWLTNTQVCARLVYCTCTGHYCTAEVAVRTHSIQNTVLVSDRITRLVSDSYIRIREDRRIAVERVGGCVCGSRGARRVRHKDGHRRPPLTYLQPTPSTSLPQYQSLHSGLLWSGPGRSGPVLLLLLFSTRSMYEYEFTSYRRKPVLCTQTFAFCSTL